MLYLLKYLTISKDKRTYHMPRGVRIMRSRRISSYISLLHRCPSSTFNILTFPTVLANENMKNQKQVKQALDKYLQLKGQIPLQQMCSQPNGRDFKEHSNLQEEINSHANLQERRGLLLLFSVRFLFMAKAKETTTKTFFRLAQYNTSTIKMHGLG